MERLDKLKDLGNEEWMEGREIKKTKYREREKKRKDWKNKGNE